MLLLKSMLFSPVSVVIPRCKWGTQVQRGKVTSPKATQLSGWGALIGTDWSQVRVPSSQLLTQSSLCPLYLCIISVPACLQKSWCGSELSRGLWVYWPMCFISSCPVRELKEKSQASVACFILNWPPIWQELEIDLALRLLPVVPGPVYFDSSECSQD